MDLTNYDAPITDLTENREPYDTDADLRKAEGLLDKAAAVIRGGGLVAFPTETVYGLGADAFNDLAVKKIFEVKGRPQDNPMIVHISRAGDMRRLFSVLTPDMVRLADAFWPGPLTIVAPKNPVTPDTVTAGLDTVAVRLPGNRVALELIKRSGTPLAAPSANISGKPSPTRGKHVINDLSGLVDMILIGMDCRFGIESTVLDISGNTPLILRPGVIGPGEIESVLGKSVELHHSLSESCRQRDQTDTTPPNRGVTLAITADEGNVVIPSSPGMKYRHYAPDAELMILEGEQEKVRHEIKRLKTLNEKLGRNVGTIVFDENAFAVAAHDLFADLRSLDEEGVDLIIAGALSRRDNVGFAVMNRMIKAAGYNIVKV